MAPKDKARQNWKTEVQKLIEVAMEKLDCKPADLEKKIKEKFPKLQERRSPGVGSRNLYKYLNGDTKSPPKKQLIEFLAVTCGEDPAAWTSRIFADDGPSSIAEQETGFLSGSEVISMQRSLEEGDLVLKQARTLWIIAG